MCLNGSSLIVCVCVPTVQRGVKINGHLIIGTAGTMLDWTLKSRVFDPKLIKMFVLDEADVMIDQQGQQDQTIRIHRSSLLQQLCTVKS